MKHSCPYARDPRLVGDPVDTLTGACVERQRDFRLAGPLPLQWWRHYDSSRVAQKFSLGWGHAHDFDCVLLFDQDGMRYEAPLGHRTHFPPLLNDGQAFSNLGKTLERVSVDRYLLSETNLPIREFTFADLDQPGRLSALIQGTDRITFQYDTARRLSAIIDSLGNFIEVSVSDDGLLQELSIAKQDGRPRRDLLTYQYDPHGNLVAGVDGFGSRFAMTYDRFHRLLRKTDRIGHSFEFAYDAEGRCVRTRGIDGVLDNRLEYLKPGELTQVTRGEGSVWQYRYQLSKLVSIVDPLGGEQKFVYDDQGKLILEVDPNGNATKSVFDAAGAVIGKQDPLGHFQSVPDDPNAPLPLAHRVAQNPAEYEFGRLVPIHQIDAAKPPAETNPSEAGKAPKSFVEQANLFSSANLGFVVGPKWWPEPESGRRFDATGDLIHQIDRKGRMRRWMYDGNGNITKYVDFDGGVWTYEYQSWNHLVRETNPLGLANRMEYDSQENLILFEDAGGTKSEYGYDLKDQLIEVRRHGKVRERYERDAAGNFIAKYAADGRLLVKVEVGAGNLVVKRVLSSGDEHTYEYDDSGRFLKANTTKDAIEFAYDGLGNRHVEKRNGLGVEHRFRGWRQFGESLWLEKFLCRQETERETENSLLLVDPAGGKHHLRRLSNGVIERRFSNGTVETDKYDELGRCESKVVTRWSGGQWRREFTWSGEGELRRVDDTLHGTTTYIYDAAHRLQERTLPNGQTDVFEFDSADNLLRQPGLRGVVLQSGNRLSATADESFTYDDRNHICERTSTDGQTTRYSYDSRDQLVRVQTPAGIWEADYDALGRRVRKTFNGQTTECLWNTDQLAGEIFPDGRLRLYMYADPLALTPLLFIEYSSVDADPQSGKRFFIFSDQIGAPICVEDDAGNIVWRAKLDPFGKAELHEDNSIEFHLRFPGHYWEDDIQLNYNRFRYYDPGLGRYLQSDPSGIAGGPNVYGYAANPLYYVDVRGLTCIYCKQNNIKPSECPPEHEGKTEVVYVHTLDGEVVYIGITDDPDRRSGEHRRDEGKRGTEMQVITEPLSHDDARTVEAKLIRERIDAAVKADPTLADKPVAEQLEAAGLDNKNRGRDNSKPGRWTDVDPDDVRIDDGDTFDI